MGARTEVKGWKPIHLICWFVLSSRVFGSPHASAEEVLPTPAASFQGQAGLSLADSKSDFPPLAHAPRGAPCVVLVLLDDVAQKPIEDVSMG